MSTGFFNRFSAKKAPLPKEGRILFVVLLYGTVKAVPYAYKKTEALPYEAPLFCLLFLLFISRFFSVLLQYLQERLFWKG